MNNKGFTLVELLATILLLSVVISITAASVVGFIKSSKENSYKILIENIKIGSQGYFEECENTSIIGETSIDCDLDNDGNIDAYNKEITISLDTLLTYGFLKSSATKLIEENGTQYEHKIIENPKNNEDISGCEIKITKIVKEDFSVSYNIESSGVGSCPKNEDF